MIYVWEERKELLVFVEQELHYNARIGYGFLDGIFILLH